MPSASSARLKGDDYQHLFAWLHALELLMPQQEVTKVIVEDTKALSADDVTLLRNPGAHQADQYHQIKYHVRQGSGYSVALLTKRAKGDSSSLLQKWFRSWERLTASSSRPLEITVVSNWPWAPRDGLGQFVDGESNALEEDFFTATGRKKAAQVRAQLAKHVGTTVSRFDQFARTMRFKLGYDCWRDMTKHAAERMRYQGLKSDEKELLVVAGIVREWVKAGRQEITRADLESVIDQYDLWLPPEARPSVNVYFTTIKEQLFDIPAQHTLDWRHYFVDGPGARRHEPNDSADWDGKMLPELRALEAQISKTTDRLVRARGLARLPAWFAFGQVFCDVAGYTIEMDQQGQLWQSDSPPSPDFKLTSNGPDGLPLDPDGTTVAVAVSVGADVENDVRRHLDVRTEKIKAAPFVRPTRSLDRHCLRDAGDAVALADQVKEMLRDFVKYHQAKRMLFYYHGPIAGACFIGHRMNGVCREVQIMEWSDPTYVPAFTLS